RPARPADTTPEATLMTPDTPQAQLIFKRCLDGGCGTRTPCGTRDPRGKTATYPVDPLEPVESDNHWLGKRPGCDWRGIGEWWVLARVLRSGRSVSGRAGA